jgi:Ser/Thr protein kinase RdoA (MazF antagonist)
MLPVAVANALGFDSVRLEPTRTGDEDSVGNGNWHLWTAAGEHHILRRYHVLRTEAARCERAMERAVQLVAERKLRELPQTVVHGDFASWHLHFDSDGRLAGVIDFDLCHRDNRAWEFVIARVHRAPEFLAGYQRTASHPLTEDELAAIEPLQVVFRVNMVMAELWSGQQAGRFDEAMIARQLTRAGS